MAEKRKYVPTGKKLSGHKTEYRPWKDWDEDDKIIAKYIDKRPNKMNKSKFDWIVEVEEAEFADKKEAKRVKGKKLTLNTAGKLDKSMEKLKEGQVAQIIYLGSKEMEGGDFEGQNAHDFDVEMMKVEGEDEDDTDTDSEDSDDSEEADDEELDEDEEDYF